MVLQASAGTAQRKMARRRLTSAVLQAAAPGANEK